MKALKALAATAAIMVLGGCAGMRGKSGPVAAAEKSSDAQAKLCNDMRDKEAAVREFPAVDSETPLSAIKDATDRAHSAAQAVAGARNEVDNPNVSAVQAANEKLQKDVNDVPGGRATVGDAAITISEDAQALTTAWDKLYTELQCGV